MFFIRLMLITTVIVTCWTLAVFTAVAPALLIIWLIVLGSWMAKKGYQLTAHGTARWATKTDLRNQNTGLMVGRMDSPITFVGSVRGLFNPFLSSEAAVNQFFRKRIDFVRLWKAVHTAVFGPTGAGKGTSLIIPHLLTCTDSMVVIDPKGENAKITAKARKAMGHHVVMLDPFKVVTDKPDTFNALDFIDPASPMALDECRDLADALVIRTSQEKEPHWNDGSEIYIAGITSAVVQFGEGEDKSLQAVRTVLTDGERRKAVINLMKESDAYNGMLSRLGHSLENFVERELGSVLTTTIRHLRFLDTLAIAESTKSSSFNPADLLKGKMTVYLILPPEHMRAQSALLRLWVGSLLRATIRGGLQEKNKVHYVLDEAASLGHMEALDDAVDKYRGYGVRLQFYYQSLGQLKKCYPEDQGQTLLSNTSQVFLGVKDLETAKHVSEALGDETIVVDSGGTSRSATRQSGEHGHHSYSYSSSQNDNWSQQARRLLKPEEVMSLNERVAISFMPGTPPVRSWLVRYYENDFNPGRFSKAFSKFKMFAAAAVLMFMSLMFGMGIVSFLTYKPKPHVSVNDPFSDFQQSPQRPFTK